MPISHSAATEREPLLGTGIAGEIIPKLFRQGLKPLIEAEAVSALGAACPTTNWFRGALTRQFRESSYPC
jgi:hypothetical protein